MISVRVQGLLNCRLHLGLNPDLYLFKRKAHDVRKLTNDHFVVAVITLKLLKQLSPEFFGQRPSRFQWRAHTSPLEAVELAGLAEPARIITKVCCTDRHPRKFSLFCKNQY
jgi:hypothetical protein